MKGVVVCHTVSRQHALYYVGNGRALCLARLPLPVLNDDKATGANNADRKAVSARSLAHPTSPRDELARHRLDRKVDRAIAPCSVDDPAEVRNRRAPHVVIVALRHLNSPPRVRPCISPQQVTCRGVECRGVTPHTGVD